MNRLALTIGLAAMDTAWLYPWSLLLGLWVPTTSGRPLLATPSIFGLLLSAALCAWFFGRRKMSRARRTWFALLALVTATLAVRIDQFPRSGAVDWIAPLASAVALTIGDLSAPVLALAMGLFLWWRGLRIGSQSPSYVEVESSFRWGIGMLVTFGLIMALSTRPGMLQPLEAQTTPCVIGFFFLSLVTLGLGRLESLRTRSRKLTVNSQWLSLLVVIAGVVVVLALVAAQVASFDALVVITRPLFDLLGLVLTVAVYALVVPLAYVVQWLIYLILNLAHIDPNRQQPRPLEPAEVENLFQRFVAQYLSPELIFGLKAVGAALLLGLGLLIVARALSRWRPNSADADSTNEERESLWIGGGLKSRLLAWLRRLFGPHDTGLPAVAASTAAVDAAAAVAVPSVRELYRQLLRLGAANGAVRAAATTPLEHVPALTRALEPDEAVRDLTEAYLEIRYADLEPSPGDVEYLHEQAARLGPRPKAATG